MHLNVRNRWVAFGVHLIISLIILAGLLSLIFFVWFPYDLIFAGGLDGLKLIMGVDLVLGPILTLMVYVPGKKGLKFDLFLIGLVQISCLGAGLWVVHNERPVIQVLANDGIHVHAASAFIDPSEIVKGLPGPAPKFVMLDLPDTQAEVLRAKARSVMSGHGLLEMNKSLYIPMRDISADAFEARMKLIKEALVPDQITWFEKEVDSDCRWVPVHSMHVGGYACVHPQKGVIQLSDRNFFEIF
jgi:hypothetical protein